MKIDRQFKPWLVAETDGARPVLGSCYVERTKGSEGVLVAANGFIMGVFPVEMDEADTDSRACVPWRVMRYARAITGRKDDIYLGLHDGRIELIDGSSHRATEGQYPPYRKIVDPITEGAVEGFSMPLICFTPSLIVKLTNAMNWRGPVTLRIAPECKGFVLAEHWKEKRPEAPYAILMPAHSTESQRYLDSLRNREKVAS